MRGGGISKYNLCAKYQMAKWLKIIKEVKMIHIDDIKNVEKDSILLLAYNADYLAREAAKEAFIHHIKYDSLCQGQPVARYYHLHKNVWDTLTYEFNHSPLPHFYSSDFENIMQAISITQHLEGDIVEIGTFQGSSARAMLNFIHRSAINKKCYFCDTFEGFTYEEAQYSIDLRWANTHTETSLQRVQEYLSAYSNFTLHKANIITDNLPESISKICLANIDVDMYEAVKAALYKVKDKVVKNGIIIAEDYGHTPSLTGAQKAVEEFLEENPSCFMPLYMGLSGQMFLIKL